MKRTTILLWIWILAAILSGCQKDTATFDGGGRGDGAFSFAKPSLDGETEYILNTASRRIHLPDCLYTDRIDEENRLPCGDLVQATAEGYTPCGHCLSDQSDTNVKEKDRAK